MAEKQRVARYRDKLYKVVEVVRANNGEYKIRLSYFNGKRDFVVPLDWIKFAGTIDDYTATGWKHQHFETMRTKLHRTTQRRGKNR